MIAERVYNGNHNAIAAMPDLLQACLDCLHQIGTDSDLEALVGYPKYQALEQLLKAAIYKADPGNPVLQHYNPQE